MALSISGWVVVSEVCEDSGLEMDMECAGSWPFIFIFVKLIHNGTIFSVMEMVQK